MRIGDVRWLRWMASTEADGPRTGPERVGPGGGGGGASGTAPAPSAAELRKRIGATAFAFRGYDVTNIGRTRELVEHERFGPTVRAVLREFSEIASGPLRERVDLLAHVCEGDGAELTKFPLDVAAIVAIECAQLRLLETFYDVPTREAPLSFGYSIGELSALLFGGMYEAGQLLPIPLHLARDCAELSEDTRLGVLFTRGPSLPTESVERLCMAVSAEGNGLIGPSAYLSPNTALLLGQAGTLDRVDQLKGEFLPDKTMLRRNPNRWPPLHSPLVWQRLIPNRTALELYRIKGGTRKPSPPVLSCVTGSASYDEHNSREILTAWTDHPQRLWDVIDETLTAGVEVVIHVGPAPTLIPNTFARLSNNVSRHLGNGRGYLHMLGRGLVSEMNRHAWLGRILPSKSALLRLPFLVHVTLEDWLLAQPLPAPAVAFPAPLAPPIDGDSGELSGEAAQAEAALPVVEMGGELTSPTGDAGDTGRVPAEAVDVEGANS